MAVELLLIANQINPTEERTYRARLRRMRREPEPEAASNGRDAGATIENGRLIWRKEDPHHFGLEEAAKTFPSTLLFLIVQLWAQ